MVSDRAIQRTTRKNTQLLLGEILKKGEISWARISRKKNKSIKKPRVAIGRMSCGVLEPKAKKELNDNKEELENLATISNRRCFKIIK
jgi:hypothetical protein